MKQKLILLATLFLISCTSQIDITSGVSHELAKQRKSTIINPTYNLKLNIPQTLDSLCSGTVEILFSTNKSQPIVIDFKAPEENIHSVEINGKPSNYQFINEHIIVNGKRGENSVKIEFSAPDQSLNRREEFLYTLLVPDRARTFFPCFDQPNLKAKFSLDLTLPHNWRAVSNGKIIKQDGNRVIFNQTEPLSTYLFSIVAGELECVTTKRGDREISLYHRETDPQKVAQIDTIFDQIFSSLEWLENYTSIKYPFAKYDLIILPGFQYGGMEHTGATIYSDRTMFLNPSPTINEELARCSLIAHETAHMWFGDYVTMDWFSDVWTKEVMANYFAALITEPMFPNVNHALNFMLSNTPSAYAEDRTNGSNSIQQELENLEDAGLVYGNIIYKKSPIIMNMLVKTIGNEQFKNGIREYLTTYAYNNATWDNLIAILDKQTPLNLQKWSDAWVKERAMPQIELTESHITQHDPLNRHIIWSQPLSLLSNDSTIIITLDKDSVENSAKNRYAIINSNGESYGYFKIDSSVANYYMQSISKIADNVTRGSILITLNENFLNHNLSSQKYLQFLTDYIAKEQNQLLFSQAIGYAQTAFLLSKEPQNIELENQLFNLSKNSITALRAYSKIVRSKSGIEKLYTLWSNKNNLSQHDAINISYSLAILIPERYAEITTKQLSSITNEDLRKQYKFIYPAVSPDTLTRDSVFNSLLRAENRSIEPWAQTSLSLLNHPLRSNHAIKYIRPALDKVKEIQKTGDIFFPSAWCGSLLGGHTSIKARQEVDNLFSDNRSYPEKLANKIKQKTHHLYNPTL